MAEKKKSKTVSRNISRTASKPLPKSGNGLSAMPRLWLESLTKPAVTFDSQKGNADWGHAFLNYALAGALGGLLSGLLYSSMLGLIFPSAGAISFAFITGIGAVAAIAGSLLVTLVLFIFAKLLGGKGTFKAMYFCGSLFAVPLAIVYQIPFVGWLAAIYGLYLNVIAVRQVHGFSTARAVATVFIPAIIAALAVVLIVLFLVVATVSTITGGA